MRGFLTCFKPCSGCETDASNAPSESFRSSSWHSNSKARSGSIKERVEHTGAAQLDSSGFAQAKFHREELPYKPQLQKSRLPTASVVLGSHNISELLAQKYHHDDALGVVLLTPVTESLKTWGQISNLAGFVLPDHSTWSVIWNTSAATAMGRARDYKEFLVALIHEDPMLPYLLNRSLQQLYLSQLYPGKQAATFSPVTHLVQAGRNRGPQMLHISACFWENTESPEPHDVAPCLIFEHVGMSWDRCNPVPRLMHDLGNLQHVAMSIMVASTSGQVRYMLLHQCCLLCMVPLTDV